MFPTLNRPWAPEAGALLAADLLQAQLLCLGTAPTGLQLAVVLGSSHLLKLLGKIPEQIFEMFLEIKVHPLQISALFSAVLQQKVVFLPGVNLP